MPISYVRKMKGLGPVQPKRECLGRSFRNDLVVEPSTASISAMLEIHGDE